MAGKKILLIDDENDIRTIARISLETIGGFEVVLAGGGEEGLEVSAREKPDLILLDVMMPGLDGPATLKRLKETPASADVPVVFLTAKALPSEIERYKEAVEKYKAMAVIEKTVSVFGEGPTAFDDFAYCNESYYFEDGQMKKLVKCD